MVGEPDTTISRRLFGYDFNFSPNSKRHMPPGGNTPIIIIMPPPSVTWEVYCFPRRQLIFSFDGRVIHHSKGLWEYIPKSILSVCTTIFKRIAGLCFFMLNVWCYTSMDLSQRALQTNRKLFFQISNFWPKTELLSKM